MKPKYIFTAVVAICLLMVTVLPRLSFASPAIAAAPIEQAAPVEQAAVDQPAAVVQAAPVDQAAADVQTVEQPAEGVETSDANTGGGRAAPAAQTDPAGDTIPVIAEAQDVSASEIPLTADPSSLESFTASVTNGQAGQLVGVYVEGQFALPVLQQPNGDDNFVANVENSLTAYSRAARFGTLGLLAHNTLSGSAFFNLKQGQDIVAVFGDGQQQHYTITGTQAYQALSPNEPTSNFIDLSDVSQTVIGHQDVFDRVYAPGGRLVFQTCIEANGIPTWGRLFVIAEPA